MAPIGVLPRRSLRSVSVTGPPAHLFFEAHPPCRFIGSGTVSLGALLIYVVKNSITFSIFVLTVTGKFILSQEQHARKTVHDSC